MIDGLDLVIDGDGHVIEVNETYERIDPKYRERRPVYTQASRGNIVRLVDGKVWGPDTECGFVGVNGNLPPPKGKVTHYRRMGTYNPWARLADMDRDQIDVAVIYPTDELPLTVTHDAGFAAARARVYNDWLHDYCEVCPQRLKGIGIVALQDVPGAIEEMHRAVTQLKMVGIQIGCTVREDTLLSDARLTDFWAEAERLNVAIAVHGPALPSLFRSYFDINRPDHMLEASHMAHTFAQMLACSNIITGGVLERFRQVRVAFLEGGAGWVPYWMHRMDEYHEVAPERWAHISAKPSEYVRSGRVFFSCEPGDEFIPFFLEHVGEDAMRSEEHTSELQSRLHLVCRLLLEKKKKNNTQALVQISENNCHHNSDSPEAPTGRQDRDDGTVLSSVDVNIDESIANAISGNQST